MPKLLQSKHGYYWVDSWDDVLTYQHVTSREQMELYQGKGIASFVSLSRRMDELKREGQIPDDFDHLGREDEFEDELGVHQTVRWARRGSYRYVPSEQAG